MLNGLSKTKALSFFWEIITLGTARARVIVFGLVLIFLAILPTDKLGRPGQFCVFKNFILPIFFRHHCPASGIFHDCFCPACGMTHGISRMMHGDFSGAFYYNHLSLFVFILILAIIFWDLKKIFRQKKVPPRGGGKATRRVVIGR